MKDLETPETKLKAQISCRRVLKQQLALRGRMIRIILQRGDEETTRSFIPYVGKENFDNWVKDPESAKKRLKCIKAVIIKIDEEIRLLKAEMEKLNLAKEQGQNERRTRGI